VRFLFRCSSNPILCSTATSLCTIHQAALDITKIKHPDNSKSDRVSQATGPVLLHNAEAILEFGKLFLRGVREFNSSRGGGSSSVGSPGDCSLETRNRNDAYEL
jgi:hypothetical protein